MARRHNPDIFTAVGSRLSPAEIQELELRTLGSDMEAARAASEALAAGRYTPLHRAFIRARCVAHDAQQVADALWLALQQERA